MKKTIFTLIINCLAFGSFAQIDTAQQYYKQPYLHTFSVRKLPDSSVFNSSMLQKHKPTLLVFFDPDCDHCQDATKKMTAKIDKIKKVQVVMVTVNDFKLAQKFYEDYKIADYPNITIARDASYDLPRFYKVGSIPDVYLYDKDGQLLEHYKNKIPVDDIAEKLK